MNKDDANQKDKGLPEKDKAALKKIIEHLRKQKTPEQKIWNFLDYIRNNP